MAHASRALAGFVFVAFAAMVAACSYSPSTAGSPSALPPPLASQARMPEVKYPLEFLNRTPTTIHIAPNGSICMNRSTGANTLRANERWETSVDTKGSGSCTLKASIFYLKFTSGTQTLFDVQFEKKVHTAWVKRYAARRSNLIKLCWFGHGAGLAGGLGVLLPENRDCRPF